MTGKWEGCRSGRDTSRSHQSRHRDNCQHAIQPLQQDPGEGGGTGLLEGRNHHQAAKKRRPWELQQLSRHYAPVNTMQAQQGSIGEGEGSCRLQAPRPAVRLPAEHILYQPDRQPVHHRGTVAGVELPPLQQLHRYIEHNPSHPVRLPEHELQGCQSRPAA